MPVIKIPANYYQQFDADYTLDVPAEGYGGWNKADLEFDLSHTAVIVMHAWDTGSPEQYPGWRLCVEYIPRADKIVSEVLPSLLTTVRNSQVKLFHVVGSGDYYKEYSGYKRAVELAVSDASPEQVQSDAVRDKLYQFKSENSFVGTRNKEDVENGITNLNFAKGTEPFGDEGVAENGRQLFGLCKESGINHLIYTGFAINGCLMFSPGGMVEMTRYGLMCSAVRQAVTAIENRESARNQQAKEMALWMIALYWGFIFDADDLINALKSE